MPCSPCQLLALSMLALKLGKERGVLDSAQMSAHLKAMSAIPDQLRTVLQQKEKVG
jgi:glucosamine 6-phosphate synthetase-like amidotransferase/phosphosugar isomerase protein